ncbi:MAG TPA: molybdopterin-dependent oxidoreductase [Candidatus Eisenbacteria bacterium]|nr:molybdopterin-dependent oxidoreductase [Candidatus Eisenbacteria bacterium]
MNEPHHGISRRDFLKLVGATAGAATVAGCLPPKADRLIAYVNPPNDDIVGLSTWYASTCDECPAGCGIHVRTREGRALKVEGNPAHPVNKGTLCARGQASVQGLYNPDRVPGPKWKRGGRWLDVKWDDALWMLQEKLVAASATAGAIQFWTGGETGTWNALLDDWCAAHGAERVAYEPFDYAPVKEAAKRAFGTSTVPIVDPSKAKYLLSLGADFLDTWGMPLAQARGYDAFHSARGGVMGKHVQVEPRLSLTGHNADEWIAIRPGTEGLLALGLAQALGGGVSGYDLARVAQDCDIAPDTLARLVKELQENRPALVLGPSTAGSGTNATETWAAVFLLNRALGSVGTALSPSPGFDPGNTASFRAARQAVNRLGSGNVKLLFVHGTNPGYWLGSATGFSQAAGKADFKVSFSPYYDETSSLCDLILPDHHALESWGDAEPVKGVRGLRQPAMRPVFQTRQTADVLIGLARAEGGAKAAKFPDATFREHLIRRWGGNADVFNNQLTQGGVYPADLPTGGAGGGGGVPALVAPALAGKGDFTLYAYPHPYHADGAGANKPWLLEIPDPVTKVAWDHWCEISPDAAKKLGVDYGDVLAIDTGSAKVELPVAINPLMRNDVIAVPTGYGHTEYGRYAQGRGVNLFDFLPAAEDASSGGRAFLATKVEVTKTGKPWTLIHTGGPGRQADRAVARAIPLTLAGAPAGAPEPKGEPTPAGSDMAHGPAAGPEGTPPFLTMPTFRDRTSQLNGLHEKQLAPDAYQPPTGYNQYNRAHHRWGMAIDLSSCIGCSSCVSACYAENNIAWVGKTNMVRGREMAWLRIERYYEDVEGGIETRFVPMMCQQCGNAPCETVCPVYATYHNPEGLNVQVYNRCVGTRYCSNNCPYKVRAFNWFDYDCWVSPLNWQLNPDLTTRSKGVMEKCTFCLQRIREGKDIARDQNRDVRDGDITPACAQGCPTQAILFGDLADANSRVAKTAKDARSYHVFADLNTLPSITYLKKVSRRIKEETPVPAEAEVEA